MKEAAGAHLDRARHALTSARVLLREDEVLDSISRAYYAILHAARATLVTVGESPKTHKGVNNRFWVNFIETGRLPETMGELLAHAGQMRGDADYDAFTQFETTRAADLLTDAEAFVEAAEALVRDLSDR